MPRLAAAVAPPDRNECKQYLFMSLTCGLNAFWNKDLRFDLDMIFIISDYLTLICRCQTIKSIQFRVLVNFCPCKISF